MSVFETGMLLCFGLAWPVSIYRTYKSRSTKGKSLFFSVIVLVGYASGIIHKVLYSNDIVMYLYIINFTMVAVDMCLWFRNRSLEKKGVLKIE